jgi:hypothetical protein
MIILATFIGQGCIAQSWLVYFLSKNKEKENSFAFFYFLAFSIPGIV